MHSLPIIGLAVALAVLGLGLFAITLLKTAAPKSAPARPANKSELREQAARKAEAKKLRIASAGCVAAAAALLILS
jgi:hypothetical protein